MTNSNRYLRSLTDDPRCYTCGATEESLEHVFRRCPATALIWKKFPWLTEHELFIKPFDSWLEFNLRECNQTWMEDWALFFHHDMVDLEVARQ